MTTTYTKYYRLPKPDFLSEPWVQGYWDSFDAADAAIYGVAVSAGIRQWVNSTSYSVGTMVIDAGDTTTWICAQNHTSAAAPTTFAQDRATNPSYWTSIQFSLRARGQWMQSTAYRPGDMVYDTTGGRNTYAVCALSHTSTATGTITDDAQYWSFTYNSMAPSTAATIGYDHTSSGLVATNVQSAIDETNTKKAPVFSPTFTGTPTGPTASVGTNTTQLATTAYVLNAVAATTAGVSTWNGRSGVVTMTLGDVTGVGGAPLSSPAFTGTPTAPTAAPGTSTTQLATTAFVAAAATALGATVGDTPPASPVAGQLWWDSAGAALYIWYADPNSSQWVNANNVGPAPSTTLPLVDGTAAVGTAPTFARADHVHPAAPSFSMNIRVFTASGTYTPSSGMLYAVIECVGGGGGAGGCVAVTAATNGSGGGGGGGYSRALVTAAQIGASQTVTVGLGGTAGPTGANNGGNGGDSSVGTLCVAKGGSGSLGVNGTATIGRGAAGGAAGTGDFSIPGGYGGTAVYSTTVSVIGSTNYGGAAGYGFGGNVAAAPPSSGTDNNGLPGQLYGGGAAGSTFANVSGSTGGAAGAAGIVVITEYL